MILLAVGSVIFGTLSFVLFMLGIGGAFQAGADLDQADALLSLAFAGLSGGGSYCGIVALLAARAGNLQRAFRFGIAASLLPPIQMLATMGTLLLRTSPEWERAKRKPLEPPLEPLWPPR